MSAWTDFKLWAFGTEDIGAFAKTFAGELGARTAEIGGELKTAGEKVLTLSTNDKIPMLGTIGDFYDETKRDIFGTEDLGLFVTNFIDEAKIEARKDITGIGQAAGDTVKNITGGALAAIPITVWIVLGFVLLFAILFYIAPMRAKG